jgi:hypothetical protein
LLGWRGLGRKGRQQIEALQQHCDPVALLETIRSNQSALINGEREPAVVMESSDTNQELTAFLSSLRLLWQQSEPAKRGGWQVPTLSADNEVGRRIASLHELPA